MRHFVFDTEQQAKDCVADINRIVIERISSISPEAVVDGAIVPRNAATGQLDYTATRTTTWAIPWQRVDGKWVVPEITENYNPPYLMGLVFNKGYLIEEESENWYPPQEI